MRLPVDTALGMRDRAMFETLYGGGLRVSELVGLNLGDLDPEQELVRVRGKGRRERLSPIGHMAMQCIEAYLPLTPTQAKRGTSPLPEPIWHPPHNTERGPPAGGTSGASGARGRRPVLIRCVTALLPTCWIAAPTCAAFRNCWDTET